MSLLEWIGILELLFLLSAYVMFIAGRMAAKDRPDDFAYRFSLIFWRTLRQKPLPIKAPVLDTDGEDPGLGADDEESILRTLGAGSNDAPSGRAAPGTPPGTDPAGVKQSTLNVRIIPLAQRDQISGYAQGTLKIHVTSTAESGAANKSVIDLLTSTLGLKNHQVLLLRGHFQPQKTFQISGMSQEDLDSRLSAFE